MGSVIINSGKKIDVGYGRNIDVPVFVQFVQVVVYQVVVNKNLKSYGVDLNATIHKIKDIDFSDELCYEWIGGDDDMSYKLDASGELVIKSIDFEEGEVVLGELVNFGCECCGSFYEDTIYDLDELYEKGYLDLVLDRLEEVLNKKI